MLKCLEFVSSNFLLSGLFLFSFSQCFCMCLTIFRSSYLDIENAQSNISLQQFSVTLFNTFQAYFAIYFHRFRIEKKRQPKRIQFLYWMPVKFYFFPFPLEQSHVIFVFANKTTTTKPQPQLRKPQRILFVCVTIVSKNFNFTQFKSRWEKQLKIKEKY